MGHLFRPLTGESPQLSREFPFRWEPSAEHHALWKGSLAAFFLAEWLPGWGSVRLMVLLAEISWEVQAPRWDKAEQIPCSRAGNAPGQSKQGGTQQRLQVAQPAALHWEAWLWTKTRYSCPRQLWVKDPSSTWKLAGGFYWKSSLFVIIPVCVIIPESGELYRLWSPLRPLQLRDEVLQENDKGDPFYLLTHE